MAATEINYDANRKAATYEADELTMEDFPQVDIPFYTAIAARYRFSHHLFSELLSLHKAQFVGDGIHLVMTAPGQPKYLTARPSKLDKYRFSCENWIYQMRRTLDSIVQYASLISEHESKEHRVYKIQVSGIDDLLKSGGNNTQTFQMLFDCTTLEEADPTEFLKIINDVFNAMKHHWIHEGKTNTFCEEWPTIRTFYTKNNDPEKYGLFLHNHNCFHLMMGFQDMVRQCLSNLKSTRKVEKV